MQAHRDPSESAQCPACGHLPGAGAKFCSECGSPLHASAPAGPIAGAPARRARSLPVVHRAERRQLTVMFCDLVGSTELSTRLDPEELGALLVRYRALVEGEVEKLGGTTARFFGDGVLVYFGYPFAREDDAIRAVRAALAIVRGMEALVALPGIAPAQSLQVHLGVHTGMVLIDRTSGGGLGDIIGETPNIASKVEALAPPDTVLVSSATHALTSELFDYAHWGPLELKGFSAPTQLYRLVGERDWRREDTVRGRTKALFGRTQETTRLARLWHEAQGSRSAAGASGPGRGGGRVVTIAGEPGIGKTRLAQWLADHAEASGGAVLKFYCAEEAVDTAFWPVCETIIRHCRLADQTRATQIHRLRRTALRAGLPPAEFVPAIADMLWAGVEPEDYPSGGTAPGAPARRPVTAEARRQQLVELLLSWVANLAAETPHLLIVENLHWADPSSRALFAELARRARGLRLLLVITSRPLAEPPLAEIPGIDRLLLDRLPSHDLEAMLTALWRDAILPGEMQRLLLDKCDGVPLFLEQLVKTVAERARRGGMASLPDVPTSLRDMLASRLDRLGPARIIALAASVIGRQFSTTLLRALLPRRANDLANGLALLVEADIIGPAGLPGAPAPALPGGKAPEQVYKFRHALLRDAAYDSLLRSERGKYHRTLAKAYRRHFPSLVEAQPELVARHASAAGQHGEALEFWWKAGLRARARSANREAMAHFRSGIGDAEKIEDPGESRSQVIRFTMASGRAALAAEGFASPEGERLNNRALSLVEASEASHLLPAALGAVFSYYQVRGPLRRARASAERLMQLTAGTNDPAVRAPHKRRMGWTLFCSGDVREGTAILAEVLVDAQNQTREATLGLAEGDAMVIGLANLGWAESFTGKLGAGARHCAEALALARRRLADRSGQTYDVGNTPGDLAYALCLSAAVAKQEQNPDRVIMFASEARDFAGAHDLPYWQAWATVLLGWGVAHADSDRGTALLLEGIAAYKATGARLFVPYNLALLAEACMAYGRISDGLTHVDEALAAGNEIDVHFMDAELLRIKARLVAQTGDGDAALATLREASDMAARHGAETILQWAERDRKFLIDGTRGPPGLIVAPVSLQGT